MKFWHGATSKTKADTDTSRERPRPPRAAIDSVGEAVTAWEGVTVHEHQFGGIEFRVGRRQLGHLHRTFADLPFTMRVRDELISAGRAKPHHVHPDTGWVSVPMRTPAEVANVIDLFRRNYEGAVKARR